MAGDEARKKAKMVPQDMVPSCAQGIYFETSEPLVWPGQPTVYCGTSEDLIWLGRQTLLSYKRYWKVLLREITLQIKNLSTNIEIFNEATNETIELFGLSFENPAFPENAVRKNPSHGFDEPCDEESLRRHKHATTLNVCGWCCFADHTSCVSNDCKLATSCSLITGDEQHSKRFNTKCVLRGSDQISLQSLVCGLREKRGELARKRKELRYRIKYLAQILEKTAHEAPMFL